MNTLLKDKNCHFRDKFIEFNPEKHQYKYNDEIFVSTTTIIHSLFEELDYDKNIDQMKKGPFWSSSKYFKMSRDEIKALWNQKNNEAIKEGTRLHNNIDLYLNNIKIYDNSIEFKYFLNFMKDNSHLEIYRTEWVIYDESLKLGGTIDMVAKNKNKELILFDWKRTKEIKKFSNFDKRCVVDNLKHLHDVNFIHYALQLSIYKYILEKKYNLIVKEMFLVVLHPGNFNENYILFSCPYLASELDFIFNNLIQENKFKKKF